MGVTYTSAQDRSHLRAGGDPGLARNQSVLLVTSLVSMLAIGLCYFGRMRTFDVSEQQRASRSTVNLAEVIKIEPLEAALTPAFDNITDRRFAARELLRALDTQDTRLALPNVGGIARLTV